MIVIATPLREAKYSLINQPVSGTFIRLVMTTNKLIAEYTHGTIEFDNFEDFERWLNLSDDERHDEAREQRRLWA